MNKKKEDSMRFWILPLILMALFAVSIFDLPYGFYTFLRIVVTALSLWFLFCCYNYVGEFKPIFIPVVVMAILWNPIIPIYLDKDTWVILDIIALIVCFIMLIYSHRLCVKEGEHFDISQNIHKKLNTREKNFKSVSGSLETLANRPLESFIEYQQLSHHHKEIVDHYIGQFEAAVWMQKGMLEKLPGNSLVIENLRNAQLRLLRLKQANTQLLLELEKEFEVFKKKEFEHWINVVKDRLEDSQKQKNDPGNKDLIPQFDMEIAKYTDYLERLEAGDFEVCKYFRSHQRR